MFVPYDFEISQMKQQLRRSVHTLLCALASLTQITHATTTLLCRKYSTYLQTRTPCCGSFAHLNSSTFEMPQLSFGTKFQKFMLPSPSIFLFLFYFIFSPAAAAKFFFGCVLVCRLAPPDRKVKEIPRRTRNFWCQSTALVLVLRKRRMQAEVQLRKTDSACVTRGSPHSSVSFFFSFWHKKEGKNATHLRRELGVWLWKCWSTNWHRSWNCWVTATWRSSAIWKSESFQMKSTFWHTSTVSYLITCWAYASNYLVAEMNGSNSKTTRKISKYRKVATKVHCKLMLILAAPALQGRENGVHLLSIQIQLTGQASNCSHRKCFVSVTLPSTGQFVFKHLHGNDM